MNILRCVSWTAVSSEEQARPGKGSLDDQRAGNLQFVQAIASRYPGNRGILLEELSVEGSRRIIDLYDARQQYPAYQRLYELIQAEAFDVLVVPRWDRLGREESLLLTLRDLCLAHHIAVAVTSSPPPSLDPALLRHDESWRIAGTIQAWSSGREDREIARRVKQGRRDRVLVGKKFLGAPYGYRYRYDSDGAQHVEVDPAQAAVVRLALVDLYLGQGRGTPAIAGELNRRGLPSPEGYTWSHGSVRDLLLKRRWVYAGFLEFGKFSPDMPFRRIEGEHTPILSVEEAQAIEEEIRRRGRGTRRHHPLSGVAWCADCDRAMAGNSRKRDPSPGSGQAADAYHYMRCEKCRAATRQEVIMAALLDFIDYLNTVEDVSALVADDNRQAEADNLSQRIAAAEAEIARCESAINRLLDAYEAGILARDQLSERIAARQTQLAGWQAELETLHQTLTDLLSAGSPHEQLEEFRSLARDMLANADTDPVGVRRWFARFIRIECRNREVVRVRLLL